MKSEEEIREFLKNYIKCYNDRKSIYSHSLTYHTIDVLEYILEENKEPWWPAMTVDKYVRDKLVYQRPKKKKIR